MCASWGFVQLEMFMMRMITLLVLKNCSGFIFQKHALFLLNQLYLTGNNGAERRTYDEIFWKRVFGSYITKEENVYDREIADYAVGMDALLEAERIKNELSEFEHSLWEF